MDPFLPGFVKFTVHPPGKRGWTAAGTSISAKISSSLSETFPHVRRKMAGVVKRMIVSSEKGRPPLGLVVAPSR